ncbi:hypothetical protein [Sorangium atrum]|uniref:Secreted protein n=1 Tax=Sorangium atrum TaxID=2995308 RepID=A0ABT5C5R6_9BACT|nr:hypothetical protein [Sorangium aterium]MDC0681303.1 hypothetical protein [Sorangium aterium]
MLQVLTSLRARMKLARTLLQTPRIVGVGLAASIVGGLGGAGCFVEGEGLPPPVEGLYYPTGLAVSPGGRVLYVANSDFDLQFNGGTVQALDLQRLRKRALTLQSGLAPGGQDASGGVRGACDAVGLKTNAASSLYPGPCGPLNLSALDGDEEVVRSSAVIGAFASNLLLVHRPPSGEAADPGAEPQARLFVPVRGDPSVTFFDVADDRFDDAGAQRCQGEACFRLDCGASAAGGRCGRDHRIGEDPGQELIRRKLPLEPFGIAAGSDGTSIVVSHQTENAVSVIVNRWEASERPQLAYVLTDLGLGPTELAAVPRPSVLGELEKKGWGIDYQPAFAVTYIASSQLGLLRYQDGASGAAPRLNESTPTPITALARGTDSRGVAFDASERQACEAACGAASAACEAGCAPACEADGAPEACEAMCKADCTGTAVECLERCVEIPIPVYVAHRGPNSLLIGELTTTLVKKGSVVDAEGQASAYDTIAFHDAAPLGAYPSRIEIGEVIDLEGVPRRRVFALAFDAGLAFSYDPAARRVDAVIKTGRGPQALAFDTGSACGDEKERCDREQGSAGRDTYSLMYIAHFTDSYLGVVDLDMRKASTFGTMILTVGTPVPPRESQ